MRKLLIMLSLFLISVILPACGGGGGGGGSGGGGTEYKAEGTVVRSSLSDSNAKILVFADVNGNGVLDGGEISTEADLNGVYSFVYSADKPALIVAKVLPGEVMYRQLGNGSSEYYLYTPQGERLISSYTTLVYNDMISNNISLEKAKTNLAEKTGLTVAQIFAVDSYTHTTAVAAKYIAASLEKFTATLKQKGVAQEEIQNLTNIMCSALLSSLAAVVTDIEDNHKTEFPPKEDVVVDDLLILMTRGVYAIAVDVKRQNNVVTDIKRVNLYGFKYRNGIIHFAQMSLQDNAGGNKYPNGKVLSVGNLMYDRKTKFNRITDNKYTLVKVQNEEVTFTKVDIEITDLHSLISKDTTQAPPIAGFERLGNSADLTGINTYSMSGVHEAFDMDHFDIELLKSDSEPVDPSRWHQRSFSNLDEYIEFLDQYHQSSWDFTYTVGNYN